MESIEQIYHTPLMELVARAQKVHLKHHKPGEIQVSSLISIKTGGCPEDCHYCPQAARYQTGLEGHSLMSREEVMEKARQAHAQGADRVCLGAAWRQVKNNRDFEDVLGMVQQINDELGVEVCATLGLLSDEQAQRLQKVGLHSYNHNIDTSRDHYSEIITTRGFDDRLKTLASVRKAKLKVCSGGIVGLGETHADRISMLQTLVSLNPAPESVPINCLVAVEGTPLAEEKQKNPEKMKVSIWDLMRVVATARIVMPTSRIRLSAGREQMSMEDQALLFFCGANSIFAGEKLLTTKNPQIERDRKMIEILGLKPLGEQELRQDHAQP